MRTKSDFFRKAAAGVAAAVFIISASASSPRAQAIPALDKNITFILPQWSNLPTASFEEVRIQAASVRARIGEGLRVRVGFTTYVLIAMSPVDPANPAAVRAALAPEFATMDAAIDRARAAGIPLCLSFVTRQRGNTDALQEAAQEEDRRNMQWYSIDNGLATGWTTLSRYARKQEAIQEAYTREIGKRLAALMAAYPETLVAASGDGEIELASGQGPESGDPRFTNAFYGIADYSPFAVAEFRDWLRQGGQYTAGQPFAGEAWEFSKRYAGDATPDTDTNGDLHTLNGDYGTTFTTWNLKHFDWSLTDSAALDLNAIPGTAYRLAGFNPLAVQNNFGFDPPRVQKRGEKWSDLWDLFRATMVWRHNLEFAKRITTSADPLTGATVPADRWFTDQIPTDYLFGFTPANPHVRHFTAASPLWTANVAPYGSMGITSFNVNFGELFFARTLNVAAPAAAAQKVRWGIFEWNPSVPKSASLTVYRAEMKLIEQYHPSLLAPFLWNNPDATYGQVEGTGFEIALRELVDRLNNVPLTLSRAALDIGATTTGASRTPPQAVRVTGVPGETPAWSITSAPSYLDVVPGTDGRSFTVALKPGTYAAGTVTDSIVVSPSAAGYSAATLAVSLKVTLPAATLAPQGSVDSPAQDAVVSGEIGVTGWAVDDIGFSSVSVCRDAVSGELAPPEPRCRGNAQIFIGNATFVPGARPDVAGSFPGQPLNEQAGWGYMLLTNGLPDGGNGTFTLSIVATDLDGHSVVIGQRRIVCVNRDATLPFGTIDAPGQGETISGSQYVNFGWALTPLPKMIQVDGSTIFVLIDGVVVGRPSYGHPRADITGLFPGYNNSSGPVGFFIIDTTTLSNGLHSIAWVVRDNAGATQGIGSRFFTVANP